MIVLQSAGEARKRNFGEENFNFRSQLGGWYFLVGGILREKKLEKTNKEGGG